MEVMARPTLSLLFFALLFCPIWLIYYSGVLDVKFLRDLVRPRSRRGFRVAGIRYGSNKVSSAAVSMHAHDGSQHNMKPPLLILHVGPQETNAAEIQKFAAENQDLFQKDNFYFLGHHEEEEEMNLEDLYNFCFLSKKKLLRSDCTHAWRTLEHKLDSHFEISHNVYISFEKFSAFHDAKDANKHLWNHLVPLSEKWNVRIVYTYRRYHEWLPYNYYQMNTTTDTLVDWPGHGGRVIPSFADAFAQVTKMESKSPPALLKRWQDHFENVSVVNAHGQGEFLPNFLCNMIPEATHVCNHVKSLDLTNSFVPYMDELRSDMLAVAAYQQGLVDKSLSRLEVAKATDAFATALHYRDWKDYPLVCPSDEQLEELLEMSLAMEREMLPGFYQEGENLLRFQFHKYKQNRVFCSVDVDAVLQDHRWRSFYQNLQHDPPILHKAESDEQTDLLPIDYPELDVNISFIGIGAQGAGTTWLTDMLKICCPQVSFGRQKEMHFWDWHRHEGLEWYSKMFPKRNNHNLLHGEITPHYMALPDEDIAEIRLLFPDVKILFLARDFIDRTWSHIRKGLRHQARKGAVPTYDPANFTDEYFMDKVTDGSHRERSNYDEALRRWYDHFPEDQILMLNFAEIKENPVGLMTQVTNYLGLYPKGTNMTAVQEVSDQPLNVGAYGSAMRPSLRAKLEELYRPHAHAFNELLKEHGYSWRLNEYDSDGRKEEPQN